MTAPADVQQVWDSLQLLAEAPPRTFDAVITDPPYCSGALHAGGRKASTSKKYFGNPDVVSFTGDDRDQRGYLKWATLWMSEALRATNPGGLLAVFCDWRQIAVTTDAIQAAGWHWRGVVVWDKTEASRPQPASPRTQAEFIIWGSRGPRNKAHLTLSPIPGVLRCPIPRDRTHPTQKPLEVLRPLCRLVPEGALILDPFCGTGSTLVAASLEGRRSVGWEREPAFVEVARSRLAELDPAGPQLSLLGGTP